MEEYMSKLDIRVRYTREIYAWDIRVSLGLDNTTKAEHDGAPNQPRNRTDSKYIGRLVARTASHGVPGCSAQQRTAAQASRPVRIGVQNRSVGVVAP